MVNQGFTKISLLPLSEILKYGIISSWGHMGANFSAGWMNWIALHFCSRILKERPIEFVAKVISLH